MCVGVIPNAVRYEVPEKSAISLRCFSFFYNHCSNIIRALTRRLKKSVNKYFSISATYHWNYDDKGEGPFAERIYEALRLLTNPKWDGKNAEDKAKSRPNFMTIYFDEPDHTGHSHGPYDQTGSDL